MADPTKTLPAHFVLASHTSAHCGRAQRAGRWHCQSQRGLWQTVWHLGRGLEQTLLQTGSPQAILHSGQLPDSQLCTGQRGASPR